MSDSPLSVRETEVLIGVRAGQTMRILKTGSVAHQATGRDMLAEGIDCGDRVTRSKRGELFAPT